MAFPIALMWAKRFKVVGSVFIYFYLVRRLLLCSLSYIALQILLRGGTSSIVYMYVNEKLTEVRELNSACCLCLYYSFLYLYISELLIPYWSTVPLMSSEHGILVVPCYSFQGCVIHWGRYISHFWLVMQKRPPLKQKSANMNTWTPCQI